MYCLELAEIGAHGKSNDWCYVAVEMVVHLLSSHSRYNHCYSELVLQRVPVELHS